MDLCLCPKWSLRVFEIRARNGCPWDVWTCSRAAQNGHLECLQYAHENGCHWDRSWDSSTLSWVDVCSTAAAEGHLECLKYAHEKGCPWDKYTCANAAENGCLECLKYAHENGCRWTDWTCSGAASEGHLECLKYATKTDVLGMKGLVLWLPNMVTSSV